MIVLCKKSYKRKYSYSDNQYDIVQHLTEDKYYEVLRTSYYFYVVLSDTEDFGELTVNSDFFYSPQEERKLKLKKLYEITV